MAEPNGDTPNDLNELIQRYARALFRYERLMEISRRLSSTLDINALLEHIVNAAAELTGAEAASILLVNTRTGVLRFEAAVDTTGFSFYDVEVPVEGSIAGWVVTNKAPVMTDDVNNDPRFFRGVDEQSSFETRNIIAVPMQTRNRVIGCMQALNNPVGFQDDDLSTMNTLAAQAAIAIQNARLFEQSDLISEMVHELRTPLAAIKSTTYILKRPEIAEEQREQMLSTMAMETDRLARMTTEFLDLARLESGRTRLQRNDVDLNELIIQTLDTVRHQAAERSVKLATDVDEDLPVISGDRGKLTQMMLNLLTNAIKYNREGGTVTVSAHLDEEGTRPVVRMSVADTGLGIAKKDLPHIFEKFYRVADTEGYTQGTGLGLAVVKRIVEGHGGKINAESTPGEGTTFHFTLPTP